jgi:hypothetical protein
MRESTVAEWPALRQMGVDEIYLGRKQEFLTVVGTCGWRAVPDLNPECLDKREGRLT